MGLVRLIAGAVLVTLGTSASALPPAQYSALSFTDNGEFGGTSQIITTTGTAASSITNPEGYVYGSTTTSGFQRVSAQGKGSGYRNQGIEAAHGTYYFGIVGPAAIDVPIILSGAAALYANGGSSVSVYETYGRNGGNESNFGPVSCYSGSAGCGTFTFTQHFDLLAGTGATAGDVGSTTLSIFLIAQEGSAQGFIDPVITIDPTFADASRYHIIFADGVGNPGGAVPEPATWAMMLAGFGGVGGMMRARRTMRVVAA